MLAVRVRVTGRVQGVGFRAFTRQEAVTAGLAGWVRNLPDGSVEAFLQGLEPAITGILDWMRAGGPPSGQVDTLDAHAVPPDPALTSFAIRR